MVPNCEKKFQTVSGETVLGMAPTKIFVSSDEPGPFPLPPSLEPLEPPPAPAQLLPPQSPPPRPLPQASLPPLLPLSPFFPLPPFAPLSPLLPFSPLQPLEVPVATLQSIHLPWNMLFVLSSTTFSTDCGSWKLTKPKPRKPPSMSYFRSTLVTVPYQEKCVQSASSVAVFGNPPTKSFSTPPPSAMAWVPAGAAAQPAPLAPPSPNVGPVAPPVPAMGCTEKGHPGSSGTSPSS
mmetsp:Transcript_92200/g.287000  ORF Transcript_92200/g.287000 Transcript_92200/m.287000 type:complete len:235 (+) Transcript_92200:380-1084(+)